MALPQDGQDANGLEKVTEIPAGKELMFIDPTTNEGGIITLENLTKQILNGLLSQTFKMDTGTQTIPEAINYLFGKTSHIPVDEISVTEKTIVVTFYPKKSNGLCILRISDGQKIATVLICIGYSVSLITWANANLYTNSNCSVNGNYYSATVTIKADQITGNEQLNGSYLII